MINMLYCNINDAYDNCMNDKYLYNYYNKNSNTFEDSTSFDSNNKKIISSLGSSMHFDTDSGMNGTTISQLKKCNYDSDDSKPISDSFYSVLKKNKKVRFTNNNHNDYIKQFMNDINGNSLDSSITMNSVYNHIKNCNQCKKKIKEINDTHTQKQLSVQKNVIIEQFKNQKENNIDFKNQKEDNIDFKNQKENNIDINNINDIVLFNRDIIITIMIGIITILILDVFSKLK